MCQETTGLTLSQDDRSLLRSTLLDTDATSDEWSVQIPPLLFLGRARALTPLASRSDTLVVACPTGWLPATTPDGNERPDVDGTGERRDETTGWVCECDLMWASSAFLEL